MIPTCFNWMAIVIYMLFAWLLFPNYLTCLVHCIDFHSWCEHHDIENMLLATSIYGLSGFLWVAGNFREYHILYNWLLVTAQLIVLVCTYIIYANILVGFHIWEWHLIYCCILLSGFGLVLLYLLEAKKVIQNRFIRSFLKAFTIPAGKV